MNNIIAFEHFFDQNGKNQKWVLDQMNFNADTMVDSLDDDAKKWLKMDSNLNQSETFLSLANLLHDRGAHLTQDLSKLQPNLLHNLLPKSVYRDLEGDVAEDGRRKATLAHGT